MAKVAKKTSSYRLPDDAKNTVRLLADTGQVTQTDIIVEALRLLAKKKKVEGAK